MMSAILYYCVVYPLSLLPLWILYRISDLLFLLFISIIPYRKKVVQSNIEKSFPDVSPRDQSVLVRGFYRHFSDLLIESIKNLSISKVELLRRMKVVNTEILQELEKKGKSVLFVSGHFNNWEWFITSQALLVPFESYGIGMPLSNDFWDKKLSERRQRFGLKVVNAKNYKEMFQKEKAVSVLVLSDQAPADARKSYWMEFLHQPSPVLFGVEQMANEFDLTVVYFTMKKVKRGQYSVEFQVLTEAPKSLPYGVLTEKHVQLLEESIIEQPCNWLWSHKRWKREVPADLDALKAAQKSKFEAKYR
jgi:Kdo2-lipid IVA lauroyltransferase/acyltransferase